MRLHVLSQGRAVVSDPENVRDPLRYVQAVMGLRSKYSDIVERAFDGDKEFQRALKDAFEAFLNAPNAAARPAEYLSLYLDEQMKAAAKGKTEEEMNAILNGAITIFRFLHNKDEFEEW